MLRVTAAVLMVLASGCIQQGGLSEAEHRFGGAFKAQATQDDIDDLRARMRAHGGDAMIMESFPPQFSVNGFGGTACRHAHAEARNLTYVASVHECRPVGAVHKPDEAASSPP